MYEYSGKMYPSDAYFSDLNSDWNANNNNKFLEYQDGQDGDAHNFLGRAAVKNETETAVFVDKILSYEKLNVPELDKNYFLNHLAVATYPQQNSSGKLSDSGKESIVQYL